jgi:hypothetical protein
VTTGKWTITELSGGRVYDKLTFSDASIYRNFLNNPRNAQDCLEYPAQEYKNDMWVPSVSMAMKSACAMILGEEPPFTNYNWSGNGDKAFKDTLDYIFVSPNFKCVDINDKELDAADDESRRVDSFPSEKQPSDHILLSVDLVDNNFV